MSDWRERYACVRVDRFGIGSTCADTDCPHCLPYRSEPPECPTCGKRQWPVIHSCAGLAARPLPAVTDQATHTEKGERR